MQGFKLAKGKHLEQLKTPPSTDFDIFFAIAANLDLFKLLLSLLCMANRFLPGALEMHTEAY